MRQPGNRRRLTLSEVARHQTNYGLLSFWAAISLNAQEPTEAGEWVLKGCVKVPHFIGDNRESHPITVARLRGLAFVVRSRR